MKKSPKSTLSRRALLRWTAGATAASVLGAAAGARAQGPPPDGPAAPPDFTPGHLRYAGGRWQEYPTALSSLLDEVRKRTSIEGAQDGQTVDLASDQIFEHPFLYLSGRYEFEMPPPPAIERLRRHLTYGGFMLIDDGLGSNEDGFGRVARALIERLFPRHPLEPLSREHPVFRSYYLIRSVGGRQAVSQDIEGIQMGIFTPVVYCRNDLGGAWAVRPDGGWVEECWPGGEPQRRSAFQLGVNIALYSMTGNYKQDLIHHPFIQRRLNQS